MKRLQMWFPTPIYTAPLSPRGGAELNRELLAECRQLRDYDEEGRKWSETNYPGGYTSYGSMDQLHRFSSTFIEFTRRLDRHVRAFGRALDWDLGGRGLVITDCWVNIMPFGAAHSLHLHPNSVVSGTYYVATPKGCSGLKFEDPRLANFMAAPPRIAECRPANQVFVTYPSKAGELILFESWLRHEVASSPIQAERISLSFNYHWA